MAYNLDGDSSFVWGRQVDCFVNIAKTTTPEFTNDLIILQVSLPYSFVPSNNLDPSELLAAITSRYGCKITLAEDTACG